MPKQPTKSKKKLPEEDFEYVFPEKPYKKIALTFIILASLLTLIIVYFSLSKATITIVPDQVAQQKEFVTEIPVVSTTTESKILSAEYIEKKLEISENFEIENFTTEPGYSTGTIIIKNDRGVSQTLITRTRFLSPDKRLFRLTKQVVVPAGGQIEAEIKADEKGASNDIAPTRFTIPGLSEELQKYVYGISENDMTGGVKKIGVLTSEEISQGEQSFEKNIEQKIKKELDITEGPNDITLFSTEIIDRQYSNTAGDQVEKYTITFTVSTKITKLPKDKLLNWTKNEYKKNIGGKDIINYNLDDFKYDLEKINTNKARIKTSISAYLLGEFDLVNFQKKEIYGLNQEGVIKYFERYPEIKSVDVHFSPFWVRSVPSMSNHIKIDF
jgi:hypothetical protein